MTNWQGPRVWSLYLSSFWKTDRMKETRDPALPPSAESLALAWRTRETRGPLPEALHHYYDDPLERLRECTRVIREVVSLSSPAERREKRVDLYLKTWKSLQEILSEWEDFAFSPDAIHMFDEAAPEGRLPEPENTDEGEREDEGDEREEDQGLEPDLAEEVMNLVEDHETDLTRTILVAVEDPEAGYDEDPHQAGYREDGHAAGSLARKTAQEDLQRTGVSRQEGAKEARPKGVDRRQPRRPSTPSRADRRKGLQDPGTPDL